MIEKEIDFFYDAESVDYEDVKKDFEELDKKIDDKVINSTDSTKTSDKKDKKSEKHKKKKPTEINNEDDYSKLRQEIYYYPNNQIRREWTYYCDKNRPIYRSNGRFWSCKQLKHGEDIYYREDGIRIWASKYVDGERVRLITYYTNGDKQFESECGGEGGGSREGHYTRWHSNGKISEKGVMGNMITTYTYERYFENGNLHIKGRFKNAKPSGIWKFYKETGKLHSSGKYKIQTCSDCLGFSVDGYYIKRCGDWTIREDEVIGTYIQDYYPCE